MSDALLEVEGLSKRFGGLEANRCLSLHVDRGEIVGLIGPNGSGKSVLFGAIAGHHAVDEGAVRFDGRDVTGSSSGELARRGLVRVFQHAQIYAKMSCLECMRVSSVDRELKLRGLLRTYPREVDERAARLLDLADLYDKRYARARELSFGQQKALEISMALMSAPKMLLLDEPTAGISPTAVDAMIDRLRHANAELGVTLLVIEHNMPAVMSLAARLYCMAGGEMLAQGSPATIRRDPAVIRAYLGAD